ncbi:hypothetical protein HPB47_014666 [Ixodes persulcatus]|uniref:Uncharacterized protein n=1 Tax=Ixodes persulcatus TaxID=34615 RepID=A0AC60QVG5_IXOPE|nr:hypothetical protein HPB47_014666 [Ixodes persulcatus]
MAAARGEPSGNPWVLTDDPLEPGSRRGESAALHATEFRPTGAPRIAAAQEQAAADPLPQRDRGASMDVNDATQDAGAVLGEIGLPDPHRSGRAVAAGSQPQSLYGAPLHGGSVIYCEVCGGRAPQVSGELMDLSEDDPWDQWCVCQKDFPLSNLTGDSQYLMTETVRSGTSQLHRNGGRNWVLITVRIRDRKRPLAVRADGGRAEYLMTETILSGLPEIHRNRGRYGALMTMRIRGSQAWDFVVVKDPPPPTPAAGALAKDAYGYHKRENPGLTKPSAILPKVGRAEYLMTKTVFSGPPRTCREKGCNGVLKRAGYHPMPVKRTPTKTPRPSEVLNPGRLPFVEDAEARRSRRTRAFGRSSGISSGKSSARSHLLQIAQPPSYSLGSSERKFTEPSIPRLPTPWEHGRSQP